MLASDFRAAARRALAGKWVLAVVAGLIVGLLGGASSGGPELKAEYHSGSGVNFTFGGVPLSPEAAAWVAGALAMLTLGAVVVALVYFTIGGVVSVGYARFNLDLIDGGSPELGGLFAYFPYFKTALCARLLTSLYIFLWTLLLIVPGIVASYSYALVPFLLAEDPDLPAGEAISRSKDMMSGNRWRLFCLDLSFIGWAILCLFTFGIGKFFLSPYQEAARAAFYRDLSGSGGSVPLW